MFEKVYNGTRIHLKGAQGFIDMIGYEPSQNKKYLCIQVVSCMVIFSFVFVNGIMVNFRV